MSSSQPIALPSSSSSHHNHPQYIHHNHSFANPANPANPNPNGQGMDYGSYYTRGDAIMTSGSYTGSTNGDDFNPASYTKHYMGSPLSWRPGSFGGRNVSGSSAFYAGSPTAHLLSGFDPNDLRSWKMSSMETDVDHNSLRNAYSLFGSDGSEREGELCRNYTCCGLDLPDLHALLDHFEESHIVVVDANGNAVPTNNGNHFPNSVDGGTMRVTVSVPFNPQCNNPPIATGSISLSQHPHTTTSTTSINHIPLQADAHSQHQPHNLIKQEQSDTPTPTPYVPDYFTQNQQELPSLHNSQSQVQRRQQSDGQYGRSSPYGSMNGNSSYASNDMAYREGVPIDPDDMEMDMDMGETLSYPSHQSNGHDGLSMHTNAHAYGSMSPPSTAGGVSVGMQGVSNSPSPPSSNSPSSMSGHGMPSPSSGVPTPPDTPITTPLSAYPSPRIGTFPANLTPGKRALQHHGSHQSILQDNHRGSLRHKISLQHIHQERLNQGHRVADGRGLNHDNARGVYASAPPSPHPGHVKNHYSHLHTIRGNGNNHSNSLNGALGEDAGTGANGSEALTSSAFDSPQVQPSAAGMAAGGSTTFPLNFNDGEASSSNGAAAYNDGFSNDVNAGNFGGEQACSTTRSSFDFGDMGIGSPNLPSNGLFGSTPESPNHAHQNSASGLSTSPGLTRHASLGALGFSGVASNANPSWNGGHSPPPTGVATGLTLQGLGGLSGLSGLDGGFGGVIHSEPTSPYVQQSHGSAFTMNYGLGRMNSLDGAVMGGLSGINGMQNNETAPACVPPALLFSPAGTANPTPVGSRSGSPTGVKAKGKGKKTGSPSGKAASTDGVDANSSSAKINGAAPGTQQSAASAMSSHANGNTAIRPAPAPSSTQNQSALQSQTLSRPPASMLLSKPFRCPKPNCNKSYKQANGLKYHMTHGSCNFAPPKDIELRDRLLEARRREGAESNPGSTPGSGASTPIPGGAVVPDPLGLGTISELELREVEKEAERRLRPFACGIGDCQRRYKNMNGLRYHYQHTGDHGAMGLALLASGQHRCLARNSDKSEREREGRRAMASAPASRSGSRASSMNRGVGGSSSGAAASLNGMGAYPQVFSSNGTYSPSVGASGSGATPMMSPPMTSPPMTSPLSQGGFSAQQEYAIQQVQAQAVQMPMNVATVQPQQQQVQSLQQHQQHVGYVQQMQATEAQLGYQTQYAELQQHVQYQQQQGEYGSSANMS